MSDDHDNDDHVEPNRGKAPCKLLSDILRIGEPFIHDNSVISSYTSCDEFCDDIESKCRFNLKFRDKYMWIYIYLTACVRV